MPMWAFCIALVLPAIAHREPAPPTKYAFAALAQRASSSNATLLNYFYPSEPTADVRKNYVTMTEHCVTSRNCYCSHVLGGRVKRYNPPEALVGKQACEYVSPFNKKTFANRSIGRMVCTWSFLNKTCPHHACITGRGKPCLYSHMEQATTVAMVALARAASVKHIIEEGREGGLSAFTLSMQGFRVSSVEYLPEDEPLAALRALAPQITLLHGDGSQLIPEMVAAMKPREAVQTMVIFDGEKRIPAHQTFKTIRDRVALGVFDDSNDPTFHSYLDEEGEVWWESLGAIHLRGALNRTQGQAKSGMMAKMGKTGTVFVVGGGWKRYQSKFHADPPI